MTEKTTDVKEEVEKEPVIFDFSSTTASKRGRKPGKSIISKTDLEAAFGFLTLGAWALQRPEYALTDEEVTQLAAVWYDVIKEYPELGRYLVEGRRVTVWGRAIITTYVILSKKVFKPKVNLNGHVEEGDNIPDSAGTTYPDSGENGLGEDYLSEALAQPA